MDPSVELRKFVSASSGIRAALAEALRKKEGGAGAEELRECVTQASALMLELKSSNRATHLAADAARRAVAEQKGVMEASHLALQNLLYEKDHLLRSIGRCRAFETPQADAIGALPSLTPTEEAAATAAAKEANVAAVAVTVRSAGGDDDNGGDGDEADAEAHAIHLARLQKELAARRTALTSTRELRGATPDQKWPRSCKARSGPRE